MKGFFDHLITRHQTPEDNLGNSMLMAMVQPRPKIRFENANITPANRSDESPEAQSSKSNFSTVQSLLDESSVTAAAPGHRTPHSRLDHPVGESISTSKLQNKSYSSDEKEHRKSSSTPYFNQFTQQKKKGLLHDEYKQQMPNLNITHDDNLGNNKNGIPEKNYHSLDEDLTNHIQQIIQRLHTPDSEAKISEKNPLISDLSSQVYETSSPIKTSSINKESSNQANPLESNTNNKQEVQDDLNSGTGLLQTPPWLAQLQTDLQHRWQQVNTKSEAESVVNVTIGRVEVKAVQAQTTAQLKSPKKPVGVMSLDAYLKQRKHGGIG